MRNNFGQEISVGSLVVHAADRNGYLRIGRVIATNENNLTAQVRWFGKRWPAGRPGNCYASKLAVVSAESIADSVYED